MAVRVILEVTGPTNGPVAAGQLGAVAEAAGAWAMVFEASDTGPASFSVHAAAVATTVLRLGVWVTATDPVIAAEELGTLDVATNGRVMGLTNDPILATTVERQLLHPQTAPELAPLPLQPLLPVLVRTTGGYEHHLLGSFATASDAHSHGICLRLPAERLLLPRSPLRDSIRSLTTNSREAQNT